MKHSNLSIFVPHVGCPNQCSFCDQRVISGKSLPPTIQYVQELCESTLEYMGKDRASKCEVAFFGGSFTAIDRDYMISLLDAACTFVGSSGFSGIRISTRPDAIDKEVLDILKKYKVTSIELGAQSMCDEVLKQNLRGHNSQSVRVASELIKDYNFCLGLQMMVGLYQSSEQDDRYTANEIISLKPDTVRIYPTIVIKNTFLAQLVDQKIYNPIELEQAVNLTAELMQTFLDNDISIIRVGLHPSKQLEDDMVAGPYHQAFRELCESKIMLDRVLSSVGEKKQIVIYVNPRDLSKMLGQKRCNITKLLGYGITAQIKIDESLKSLYPIVEVM